MATSSTRTDLKLAAGLLVFAVLGQLALLALRHTASVVSGDEGTYLAMTESLALDGDLVFGPEDLERLEAASERGRKGVILQEFGDVTAYSKPVAYAVLTAPWYRLAGTSGLIAFQILALVLSLLLAWGALLRSGARNPAATVATFAGAGVLMSYSVWTMSDSLQASLALAGLALGLGGVRARAEARAEVGAEASAEGPKVRAAASDTASARFARFEHFWTSLVERPWAPYVGVALLAIVASMRIPNLVLAGAPVLAWLFRGKIGSPSPKRWLRPILLAAVVVLVTGSGSLLNQSLGGAAVPYKAVRATFNPQSGYPVGEGAAEARRQFSPEVALATQTAGAVPDFQAEVSLYATAYFWIGRHTGLLWYFPLAGLLLVAGLRRPDAVTWALLLTAGALALFYLVWMPRNYFGGATFLGNRYFLTGYAALLLLPCRGVSRRLLGVAWAIALVAFVSALVSVARTQDREPSSQNHAYAGIFRLLPYETVAEAIDGRSDVYWTEEFFRFVDPYAIVDPTGFSLPAGDPAAELLHVSQREAGIVRFVARADTEVGEIVYKGQGMEKTFHLEPNENGVWGLVEIELRPTKRRHKYWFHPTERLHTRTHHFQLRTLSGAPAGQRSAQLHYIGSMRLVPKFFRGIVMKGELPKAGRAGKRTIVPIRVRNTGYRFWSSEEMIPTRIGYRLFALPRTEGDKPVAGRLQNFDGRVPRAHEVDIDLEVRWPKKPGRYQLVVDLNLGKAVWYESWNLKPLASSTVRVREAAGQSDSSEASE